MDPAVTPLFYMFHYHWDKLADVTKTCDSSAVKTHLENVGAVYTTSKLLLSERTTRLSSIKARLNQILDEFTPGSRSSPKEPSTSAEYVKAIDCSVALYDALQRYTACPAGAAVDSQPFCSNYGVLSPYQSGLYYFLDYTMYEVPFAWWHKCMLLQGRTFSGELAKSSTGFIQCDAWRTNSIREEVLNVTTFSAADSTWETLQKIEGGITSAMLQEAVDAYKILLQRIVRNYMNSGFATTSDSQAQVTDTGEEVFARRYNISVDMAKELQPLMSHRGAEFEYNMKCFSKTSMPDRVEDFLRAGDPVDCVGDTLWWMHSDGSRKDAWTSDGNPFEGSNGIHPACYTLRRKDLVSATGARQVLLTSALFYVPILPCLMQTFRLCEQDHRASVPHHPEPDCGDAGN